MKKVILLFAGVALSLGLLTACGDSKEDKDMKDTKESTSMKDTSESMEDSSDSMGMKEKSDSDDAMMDSDSMMAKFTGVDEHKVSGDAKIEGDKLELMDFKTDEGPDLHVYLMRNDKIEDSVDLGKVDLMKADQTFMIPSDVMTKDYNKVGIYCNEAHVLFGEAEL